MQVYLDLTCPEHHHGSNFPKAIRNLIYTYRNDGLLSLAPNSYCSPNSGGQHRLTMSGKRADIIAWLDLFSETFGKDVGPEVAIIKHRIRTYFIQNSTAPSYHLKLKEIERQIPVHGELKMRPWFWTMEDELHGGY